MSQVLAEPMQVKLLLPSEIELVLSGLLVCCDAVLRLHVCSQREWGMGSQWVGCGEVGR